MVNLTKHYNIREPKFTHPSMPAQGYEDKMVKNRAGGYSFTVSKFKQLERFLIIGTEGGTYYATEQNLTKENAKNVVDCLATDPRAVVDLLVDVSVKSRAAKNDYALFALAMAVSPAFVKGSSDRDYAWSVLPKVARIGTHLLTFVNNMEAFRGWGRAAKKEVGNWFNNLPTKDLAYQAIKYRNRSGWKMGDVLKMAHPNPNYSVDPEGHAVLYNWLTNDVRSSQLPANVQAMLELHKRAELNDITAVDIINTVKEHNLPWEAVPYQFLNNTKVLDALLQNMNVGATLRQLGKMTAAGLLDNFSANQTLVVDRLTNLEALKKARIHPINEFIAWKTYASGHGLKGSLTWKPNRKVIEALEAAFYLTIDAGEPLNKKTLIAVDASGSMSGSWGYGNKLPGGVSSAELSAAFATALYRKEKQALVIGFDTRVKELRLGKNPTIEQISREIGSMGGGTDCSLPYKYLQQNKYDVDVIISFTDSETWARNSFYRASHPIEEAKAYDKRYGPKKHINAATTATNVSVLDNSTVDALEVVGFDASVPKVIEEFVKS